MGLRWQLLRRVFIFSVSFEVRSFERSLKNPAKAQAKALRKIQRRLNFRPASLQEFRLKYQITGEEQLVSIGDRLRGINIVDCETTSGSSGKPKNIPYTKSLLGDFQHMFRLWAWDIVVNVPLQSGTFFFSVSPQAKESRLSEDSGYLQSSMRWLMKDLWTIDASKLRKQTHERFMRSLAKHLLARPDLEIISVWSPSYLLVLLSEMQLLKPDWNGDTHEIFPKLKIISVWGSAMAERGFQQIRERFPTVLVQAKGLIATEAPLTIPWFRSRSFVPLVEDIFFEFLDENNEVLLLTELTVGQTYEVVITTSGGLIRYRLGDLVRVAQMYGPTPCLEFVGRAGEVCDLAGEKLSECAVRIQLQQFESELGFYIVVPDPVSMRYLVFAERDPQGLISQMDRSLQNIFHYEVARQQRQLDELEAYHLAPLREIYYRWLEGRQMRLGDIKEKCLISKLEMAASFLEFVRTPTEHRVPFDRADKPETNL